jgi:hypothetical protein
MNDNRLVADPMIGFRPTEINEHETQVIETSACRNSEA